MAKSVKGSRRNGKMTTNEKVQFTSAFNAFTSRLTKLWNLLAPNERRDIDTECGWTPSEDLTPETYKKMFERESTAARVVGIWPDECWKLTPEIFEKEDVKVTTPFEASWEKLEAEFQILSVLKRVDEISGIGQFGIIVLGIGDGKTLDQPIENVDDYGRAKSLDGGGEVPFLYVSCYDETEVDISEWNTDSKSPRFGRPEIYSVKMAMGPTQREAKKVHWTRVIHIADNVKGNPLYGFPRMQQCWNRLLDIRKILGGSAEGVWRSGFPILVAEADGELVAAGAEFDEDSLKEQFDAVMQGMQRQLMLQGATAKSIGGGMQDTSPQLRDQLENLCIAIGVPLQIFIGNEIGMRSAEQNSSDHNDRVNGRRNNYVTPFIIVPLIDRLIAAKVLAAPGEDSYQVWWPDPNAPTPKEQAEVAKLVAEVMAIYVRENLVMMIAPDLYLTLVLGWEDDEAEAATKSVKKLYDEEDDNPLIPQPEDEDGSTEQQEGQESGGAGNGGGASS
jgi:hypothetical protein